MVDAEEKTTERKTRGETWICYISIFLAILYAILIPFKGFLQYPIAYIFQGIVCGIGFYILGFLCLNLFRLVRDRFGRSISIIFLIICIAFLAFITLSYIAYIETENLAEEMRNAQNERLLHPLPTIRPVPSVPTMPMPQHSEQISQLKMNYNFIPLHSLTVRGE